MSALRYVTIEGETYLTGSVAECEVAEAALRAAGLDSAAVWEAPYDSIESADAAGWDGERRTGTIVLAEVRP